MACRGSAVRVRLAPLGFQGFEHYNLIQLVQNLVQIYLFCICRVFAIASPVILVYLVCNVVGRADHQGAKNAF